MSLLFFISFAGMITILTYEGIHIWSAKRELRLKESKKLANRLGQLQKKEAAAAKRLHSMLSLGEYTLELKSPSVAVSTENSSEQVQLEIEVVCDDERTRDFLSEQMPKVRDRVIGALMPMGRDELITPDGKKKLKSAVIRKLNAWLPRGKIEELYFSKLIMN